MVSTPGMTFKRSAIARDPRVNLCAISNAEPFNFGAIEGTVDMYNLEEEGPYHEMYGYMGIKKEQNFVMTVDTITHRDNPWVLNSFTGVVQEYITAAQRASRSPQAPRAVPALAAMMRSISSAARAGGSRARASTRGGLPLWL